VADLIQIDVQQYQIDCANCGACSVCCYLQIAVEYVASENVSDTFDLYAVSADLPGGELLIGRVTDEDAGGDCDAAGIDRGVIFLPDSMDGVEPNVPDDTIDLADYDVIYTAALDELAASGACDVSLEIRAVTDRGCGNASGQLHVYAVCRGPDPVEIDGTIYTGSFASTAGAYPWADTEVVAAFDLCCGVDSPCCGVAGAHILPLLKAELSGPLTAGGVGDELVYQPDVVSEAGTHPWRWEFSQGGHDYRVDYMCVLFGDGTHTWRYDIFCDLDEKEAAFFAAHPSCAGDPEYDADYDFNGDGCVDNLDLFMITETPSLFASGAGGGVTSATDCASPGPGHAVDVEKTITSTEGGCFGSTGTLTLEVDEV
jgi:hypothetical protein